MIIVFDAKCLLCNGWVQFLLKHDRRAVFRFASIQGATGLALLEQHGLQVEGLDTLLVIKDNGAWRHTAAILRVLDGLGWPWKTAWVLWLIPAPLRDALYRLIARNRYRWLGRSETCMVPDPANRQRFLD